MEVYEKVVGLRSQRIAFEQELNDARKVLEVGGGWRVLMSVAAGSRTLKENTIRM